MHIPEEHRAQLRATLTDAQEQELLDGVQSVISPEDGMFRGDGRHYYSVGLSALRCVRQALDRHPRRAIKTILDLPSGYGRVLRFLRGSFPDAHVHACDILKRGVDFCATELGAVPAYSSPDLDRLDLDARFDLIWCGSLVTHLPEDATFRLLRFFARHLAPGGVLLLSTHGDFAAQRMRAGKDYGSRQDHVDAALRAYEQDTHGFIPNPRQQDYGISLTSPACIRRHLTGTGWSEIDFQPRGWDNHHDIFAATHAVAS
jgi:SAM-dependent methyltransferase